MKLMQKIENFSGIHLKKLGPRRTFSIPMKVTRPDQTETSNIEELCEAWKNEFVKVYNPELNENFDDKFYRWAITYRQFLEQKLFYIESKC